MNFIPLEAVDRNKEEETPEQERMELLRSSIRAFLFLFLLLLILPLYLSRVALRLITTSSSSSSNPLGRLRMRPPTILLALALAPLLLILTLTAPPLHGVDETDRPSAASELGELRSKVARLESILEGSRETMTSKISQLNEKMRFIEELDVKIRILQESLDNLKRPLKGFPNQGSAEDMEEEVRLLWAKMRENNFDIYLLETKAEDAESKFKSFDSQLQEIKDIVTEQWIQIRHLEQALQMTKMRNSKSQAKLRGCCFLKFFVDLHQRHLLKYIDWMCSTSLKGKKSVLWFFLSKTMNHIKKVVSDVQRYHHELQHSVMEMLESNDKMAAFAHEEVAFILASGIVVLPMLPIIFLFVSLFNH